jgi:hypothetical protein
MPVKRASGRYELTSELRMAVNFPERWAALWGGPEAGRAAWLVLAGQLCRSPVSRPECWWFYREGVPPELREALARPDPRVLFSGPPDRRFLAQSAAADAQRQARYDFLVACGEITRHEPSGSIGERADIHEGDDAA